MAISLPHQCRIRRRHRGQARLPQRYLPYTNAAPAKKKPVGAGLPAMAISLPHQCRMCRRHRQQAGSHSDLRRTQILRPPPIPVGARLAPDGNLPATSISNVQTPSPAGWLPQWSAPNINTASTTIPLWERACPRWQSPCHINVECADAVAGKPGSHSDLRRTQMLCPPTIPMGAAVRRFDLPVSKRLSRLTQYGSAWRTRWRVLRAFPRRMRLHSIEHLNLRQAYHLSLLHNFLRRCVSRGHDQAVFRVPIM